MYTAEPDFLNLSDIQNFLDQFIQVCDILAQDTGIFLQFSVSQPAGGSFDIIVHTINQGQRRAKLMRNIGKEIQFRFIQFFFLFFADLPGDFGLLFHNPAAQPIHDAQTCGGQQQAINNHSPRTAIPRRQHSYMQKILLAIRIEHIILVTDFQNIIAIGQLRKSDLVVFLQFSPRCIIVYQ